MLDRSFFWDSESRRPSRAGSLFVGRTPDEMSTLSEYTQSAQNQQRPAEEAPCRRYVRRLAKAERARIHQRRSHHNQHAAANSNADFEQTFQVPIGPNIAANTANAGNDLQDCVRRYKIPEPMCLTPMERFLVIDPVHEPLCVESRAKLSAVPAREGSRTCAESRVQRAVKLAEAVSMTRLLAALQGPTSTEEVQAGDGHERSWLDLDEDQAP